MAKAWSNVRQASAKMFGGGEVMDEGKRIEKGEVVMTHYNLLASVYGSNMNPWFLYGIKPSVSKSVRSVIMERYRECDENGEHKFPDFESLTEGILNAKQQAQAKDYDAKFFAWDKRKDRLVAKILQRKPDIVTLVECDHYEDFFKDALKGEGGLESIWVQRPQREDGMCLAWKDSRYELLASRKLVFTEEGLDGESRLDTRAAAMVYLQERETEKKLLLMSTHLAKLPENMKYEWSRAREIIQLSIALQKFVQDEKIPVDCGIICGGDMNTMDMGRLTSIGNVITWLTNTKQHNFFYRPKIIKTDSTSFTEIRDATIDYILYAKGALSEKRVHREVKTTTPIPNKIHPSDHQPVSVTLSHHGEVDFKKYSTMRYFENVAKHKKKEPMEHLSLQELTAAFEYFAGDGDDFDIKGKDVTTFITQNKISASASDLVAFYVFRLRKYFEIESKEGSIAINFKWFSEGYYNMEFSEDQPLEMYEEVFHFLDVDGSNTLEPGEVKDAIEKVAGKNVHNDRFEEVLKELDVDSDNRVTKKEFLSWIRLLHKRMHLVDLYNLQNDSMTTGEHKVQHVILDN